MRRTMAGLMLLTVYIAVTTAANAEPGRLGCYEDNPERVWKQWQNTHEKNTIRSCKNLCQDFKYAGLQAGNYCMCGDEIPPKTAPESRCKGTCPGNPAQTCGGHYGMEVYPVDPKPELQGKSMGCFQDTAERVWKTGYIHLQSNSHQRCINACRGFKYAGVEAGNTCACGDTLPPTPLPKTSCNYDCKGYAGKMCGGHWAMEVFEISKVPECVPSDYQIVGNHGIYKLYTEPESWTAAWQHCVDDDAHLLILNSEAEAKFVRSLFAQVPNATRMHAGFHDHERKGVYRTLFGKALSATGYTAWSKQYPKKPSPLPHCGAVDKQAKLAQVDGNCVEQAPFVCEKNSRSPDAVGKAVQFDVKGALAAQKS